MKNNTTTHKRNSKQNLGSKKQIKTERRKESYIKQIVAKNVSQTRKNITDWTVAQKEAERVDDPKRVKISQLYKNILLDGHLSSQINLRKSFTTSADFKIHQNGNPNDELTELFKDSLWFDKVIDNIIDSILHGHTLMEFDYIGDELTTTIIPRAHVVPNLGLFYPDYSGDKYINYRETREYGTWTLEFGDNEDLGILNKCVPCTLFKRFATNSWGQLIEIFGIPPRVMKTDTTDIQRLNQAEDMMKDMATSSWLILDEDEK